MRFTTAARPSSQRRPHDYGGNAGTADNERMALPHSEACSSSATTTLSAPVLGWPPFPTNMLHSHVRDASGQPDSMSASGVKRANRSTVAKDATMQGSHAKVQRIHSASADVTTPQGDLSAANNQVHTDGSCDRAERHEAVPASHTSQIASGVEPFGTTRASGKMTTKATLAPLQVQGNSFPQKGTATLSIATTSAGEAVATHGKTSDRSLRQWRRRSTCTASCAQTHSSDTSSVTTMKDTSADDGRVLQIANTDAAVKAMTYIDAEIASNAHSAKQQRADVARPLRTSPWHETITVLNLSHCGLGETSGLCVRCSDDDMRVCVRACACVCVQPMTHFVCHAYQLLRGSQRDALAHADS